MYLVDTNTVSDAHKGVPEPVRWLSSVDPDAVYLSVITIGEISRGIEHIRDAKPAKARQLTDWLTTLRSENEDRILPITEPIAVEWGRMSAHRRRPDADGLILATAKVHGLAIVTRNVIHFQDAGVPLVNPWLD